MKRMLVIMFAFSFLCGCATFGTFANFKKGKTTKVEVRSVFGEPANMLFKDNGEIWEYHFLKREGKDPYEKQTIMNLSVTFKEDVVDNYKVTISKKSVPEKIAPAKELLPSIKPTARPSFKQKEGFIEGLDKNNDHLVSREEFPGPSHVFDRFDTNGDGYIEESEAPKGHMLGSGKGGDFITQFDRDNDGQVSRAEFPGPDEVFNRFDTNGDGYIDDSEAPKGPPQGMHPSHRRDRH